MFENFESEASSDALNPVPSPPTPHLRGEWLTVEAHTTMLDVEAEPNALPPPLSSTDQPHRPATSHPFALCLLTASLVGAKWLALSALASFPSRTGIEANLHRHYRTARVTRVSACRRDDQAVSPSRQTSGRLNSDTLRRKLLPNNRQARRLN